MNWLILTIATGITAWLIPGISTIGDHAWVAYGSFALFMALINASIKPILHILAIPFTIFTFGIGALIINALCFELASNIATNVFGVGIIAHGLGWSILGAIVISIASSLLSGIAAD
ncbi:phage holin family protein [Alloscardovia theropitheci]|nr:phage holin family protein [Alloscardovia theropitheci]